MFYFFIILIGFISIINVMKKETLKINELSSNTELAIFLEDTKTSEIPSSTSGYYFDRTKSSCSDEALLNFDSTTWTPVVSNVTQTRTKCNLYFTKIYTEQILNGTDPVLKNELTPVIIADDGTVRKADLSSKWYEYANQKWANAVILKDESKSYYDEEVIPENNIESYFVWIPRYKYKIFNEGNYTTINADSYHEKSQKIEVIFENKNTPVSNGSTVGSYLTHPAFTSFNSNGMWVGKFQTGKTGGSDNVRAAGQVQIKPNVSSWRNIQVVNAFYTSYDYKRGLDSHMTKNTEWGAIAYLSHSKYGINSRIRMNNNEGHLTGYSALKEPTCGHTNRSNESCNSFETTEKGHDGTKTINYFNPLSVASSTTGNYSGIFDISGNAWEMTMSFLKNSNGEISYSQSGFTSESFPIQKYYDSYIKNNLAILGDATLELGPFSTITNNRADGTSIIRNVSSWYFNAYTGLSDIFPIYMRGGSHWEGIEAGAFAFGCQNGSPYDYISFRIILTP